MATTSKQFAAPAVSGGTALTFRATVTDTSNGNTSTDDVVVNVNPSSSGVSYTTTKKTFTAPTQSSGARLTFRASATDGVTTLTDDTIVNVAGATNIQTTTKTFTSPATAGGANLVFRATVTDGTNGAIDDVQVTVRPGLFAGDSVSFTAPDTATGTTLTFRATATDANGNTATDDVVVTVSPTTRYAAQSGSWAPVVRVLLAS